MEYPKFKVTVSCMTYNQAKYITDAMNGFTMQQTSFPFVCTIVDDASTDGEQEVIRKYVEENFDFSEDSVAFHKETDYAHITYAQHKTNKNCYFAVLYLKENHYSRRKDKSPYLKEWRDGVEYMAICEGDDYWIVQDKLEKQVIFLDENEEYVLVHTNFKALNTLNGKMISNAADRYNIENGNVFENLFEGCFIRTPTVCYRNALFIYNNIPLPENTFDGDLFIFYVLARKGKFFYFNEETCIYRVLQESASHTVSEDIRKLITHRYKNLDYFIADYYGANIIELLDCKWFKVDLRNCIATKDADGVMRLNMPKNISYGYKLLYYGSKSRTIISLFYYCLKLKRMLFCNNSF